MTGERNAQDVPVARELGVLRWAAGSGVPSPAVGGDIDEKSLLSLLRRHALAGRLLQRLDSDTPPSWVDAKFYRALVGLQAETRALVADHAHATAEITRQLGAGQEPVLVKGISAYLTTGAPHTMRCGDIDLVVANGDQAIDVLTALGYQRTRAPFMHEVGEFTFGGTEVDVHAYYPVHGYGSLPRSEFEPSAHNGIWQQPGYQASLVEISYRELARGRIRCPVGRSGAVNVPDPCLLAIILCAHAFMNFTNMWSISHRAKPYVKLAELADLYDLVRHPGFDPARFLVLVRRFDATDAVLWAAWASLLLTGRNPLPVRPPAQATPRFPRCLWWSLWAEIAVEPDALLRPYWLDMPSLMPLLGCTELNLDAGTTGQMRIDDVGGVLRRQIRQTSGPIPSWAIEIRQSGDWLTLAMSLPSRPAGTVERGRVDFGDLATEWSLAAGSLTMTGDLAEYELCVGGDDARRLVLRYPLSKVAGPTGRVSLLAGIASEDSHRRITHCVILPLIVRLNHKARMLPPLRTGLPSGPSRQSAQREHGT
jgi:hypothetical protein